MSAWAVRELATHHGGRLASVLASRGVQVMLLKGAWLQAAIYADPDARPMADLDLLVRARDLPALRQACAELGYARVAADAGVPAEVFAAANGRLLLDVHREPLPAGLFALRAEHLWASARPIRYGDAQMWAPSPLEGYAHLVAHFVKGRHDASDRVHAGDFAVLARAAGLAPERLACHLERRGLGRATRYVMRVAEQAAPDAHHQQVLAALRPDPLGERLAAMSSPERLSGAFAFALDSSLHKGGAGLVRHALSLVVAGDLRRVFRSGVRVAWARSAGSGIDKKETRTGT